MTAIKQDFLTTFDVELLHSHQVSLLYLVFRKSLFSILKKLWETLLMPGYDTNFNEKVLIFFSHSFLLALKALGFYYSVSAQKLSIIKFCIVWINSWMFVYKIKRSACESYRNLFLWKLFLIMSISVFVNCGYDNCSLVLLSIAMSNKKL